MHVSEMFLCCTSIYVIENAFPSHTNRKLVTSFEVDKTLSVVKSAVLRFKSLSLSYYTYIQTVPSSLSFSYSISRNLICNK